MTDNLQDLARRAMGLPGAPLVGVGGFAWKVLPVDSGPNPDAMEWIWDLADTSPAGWALGGVLLGAIWPHTERVVVGPGNDCGHCSFMGDDARWHEAGTLAEACCWVALSLGRWPGGVE